MDQKYILWPILAQILLTFVILAILGMRRAKAYKTVKIDAKLAKLDARAWPDNVIKVSNNLTNQYETPVLFYVLAVTLLVLNAVDTIALVLAWVFVISRIAHAYVHLGSNYVPKRFMAFATGCAAILGMGVLVAWHCLQ